MKSAHSRHTKILLCFILADTCFISGCVGCILDSKNPFLGFLFLGGLVCCLVAFTLEKRNE